MSFFILSKEFIFFRQKHVVLKYSAFIFTVIVIRMSYIWLKTQKLKQRTQKHERDVIDPNNSICICNWGQ